MSNLAKVICFLLAAGATSVGVHFSLEAARESFDRTVFHSEAYCKSQHDLAKWKLENLIKLAESALGQLTAWNDSSNDRVVQKRECYEDYKKSCHSELKNLPKVQQAVLRRFEESKIQAENCLTSKIKLFRNVEAAKCILKVRTELLTIFERDRPTFDKVARKMNKKIDACNELSYPPLSPQLQES